MKQERNNFHNVEEVIDFRQRIKNGQFVNKH